MKKVLLVGLVCLVCLVAAGSAGARSSVVGCNWVKGTAVYNTVLVASAYGPGVSCAGVRARLGTGWKVSADPPSSFGGCTFRSGTGSVDVGAGNASDVFAVKEKTSHSAQGVVARAACTALAARFAGYMMG